MTKRLVFLIATPVLLVALVFGGLAIAQSFNVSLNSGDTATATCSGTNLSSQQLSAISISLNCTGTTTPPTTTPPAGGSWWVPPVNSEWQWYLNGEISNPPTAAQLGTGQTAWNGTTPPATNPTVIDVDGIDNTAADVARLHALGDKVICYIEVGTAGNYGGAYTTYYNELSAAGDLGNKLSGYPENFININAPSAVTIVESIIQQQCSAKGFDAVETDLDETFGTNEGNTGFSISEPNEVTYLTTLSSYIHSLDMGWIAKDVDDTGNQSFVNSVEPMADGVITEQCNQYGSCSLLQPFTTAGKAIFDAEYAWASGTPAHESTMCTYDNKNNLNGAVFNVNLNGKLRTPCR